MSQNGTLLNASTKIIVSSVGAVGTFGSLGTANSAPIDCTGKKKYLYAIQWTLPGHRTRRHCLVWPTEPTQTQSSLLNLTFRSIRHG